MSTDLDYPINSTKMTETLTLNSAPVGPHFHSSLLTAFLLLWLLYFQSLALQGFQSVLVLFSPVA